MRLPQSSARYARSSALPTETTGAVVVRSWHGGMLQVDHPPNTEVSQESCGGADPGGEDWLHKSGHGGVMFHSPGQKRSADATGVQKSRREGDNRVSSLPGRGD